MTSSEEKSNVASMKQKLINHMSPVKEETRSFLNFSRENLSISHSDLEEGFNRSRLKLSKNTILSLAALIIAVLCLGLESWELHCSLSKLHDIEQLKRDVESLKHRLLEQDLLDELKAFEQLYTEESTEDNDPGEADIDNADYDSNYNDDDSTSRDYSDDRTSYDSKLDLSEITSTSVPASYPESESNRAMEILTAFRKAEAKRGEKFVKNVRESHKNIDRRERLNEENNARLSHEKNVSANVTEHQRDNDARDIANTGDVKEGVKSKRSISDHTTADDSSPDESNYEQHGHYVKTVHRGSRPRLYANNNTNTNNNSKKNLASHSSKKHHSRARLEAFSLVRNDQLSQEIIQHANLSTEAAVGKRVNWRNTLHDDTANRTEIRRSKFPQNFKISARNIQQRNNRLTRRALHAPRQIYAIHFGADTTLFSSEDEHVGNGKARHNNGIFKAWQPSDWVADLGMNRHFTLATDGKLTVHEPGLYLVYAQIHYLDEHDENGFRLLVNGRSIMQCMVYNPGTGHKSRSCFSAQVIILHEGDHLILKDVGTARYTLFQHDKSFFGLTKLGELRQPRHQPTPSTH